MPENTSMIHIHIHDPEIDLCKLDILPGTWSIDVSDRISLLGSRENLKQFAQNILKGLEEN